MCSGHEIRWKLSQGGPGSLTESLNSDLGHYSSYARIPHWDGTGQDLETLEVPGPKIPRTKEVKKSLFLDMILLMKFKNKVQQDVPGSPGT